MKTTLNTEYLQLIKRYGSYNMNVIFNGLKGYSDVRSYTSKRTVINEINNILID